MKKEKSFETELLTAQVLRKELLKDSETIVQMPLEKTELSEMELVSTVEKPYVSPIFTMNEDEILAFVEEFEINELATLSTAELNHIGKVLGIDPQILVEGED